MSTLKYSELVKTLNANYPLSLGEKWDNVGILVEPSNCQDKPIENIFLTIDLTEPVLDEALGKKSDFIISYHPPLFNSFKVVTQKTVSQRIAVRAIESKTPIYSPHSILDSVKGGMNDWMSKGLLELTGGKGTYRPLQPTQDILITDQLTHKLVIYAGDNQSILSELKGMKELSNVNGIVEFATNLSQISKVLEKLKTLKSNWNVQPLVDKISSAEQGPGRLVTLDHEVDIEDVIKRIKQLFNQTHIRIARPLLEKDANKRVKTISLCPGSGGMMIFGERADLYLTGELKHHEILDAAAKGSYVIVCDHTNTERGYLQEYKTNLLNLFKEYKLTINISEKDKDPLSIV